MPSKSSTRSALAWVLVLALGLPALAWAAGVPAHPTAESSPDAGDAGQAAPEAGDAATAALSGVTITWDLEARRFRAPSPGEATRIAQEFNRMMAERFAHGKGVLAPAGGDVEVRTLADGTKMARLPAHLLNASVVRVGADGRLESACVDTVAQTPAALSAPAADPVEER